MPNASLCVKCLERRGDVPLLKRYDEFVGSEEVQTYFKRPNPYLALQLQRRKELTTAGHYSALFGI